LSEEEERVSAETTSAASMKIRGFSTFDIALDHKHPEMQRRINELESIIERLSLEINDIRNMIETAPLRIRLIETKEVSVVKAKRMIMECLKTNEIEYPDDIADYLGLDLKVTVEAVEQLIKEGKIKEKEK